MPGRRGRRKRYKITYKRRGWGNVEFVKIYEHEMHGLEMALAGFVKDHSLSRDEVIRVEEIDEMHLQGQQE
jgi:hypothetical protein